MPDLKSFDRVAHLYDETRGIPPEAERQIGDGIAALLRETAAQPRLLEVGIGTGRIAVPLAERGIRVTGIDISTKMLAILRGKRTDIDVMIAEASQPPLRERSFDAALFVHILHLVPDPEATIRATLALMRPGGVMIEAVDDWTENIRSRADALIWATVAELSGVSVQRESDHRRATVIFEDVLRNSGAEVRAATVATWRASVTGQHIIDRLKRRDYSSSWKIPNAVMPQLLERVTPQIAELFGGLETAIESPRSIRMRYARLPA
jgi:ubiquinone/menaquinone biosynthesis C-methylase UbiE